MPKTKPKKRVSKKKAAERKAGDAYRERLYGVIDAATDYDRPLDTILVCMNIAATATVSGAHLSSDVFAEGAALVYENAVKRHIEEYGPPAAGKIDKKGKKK